MRSKTLLGAAALALITAAPVAAAPIELDFSFDGVSGTFYGLDNADGTSRPTSYDFNGVLDTYTSVDVSASDLIVFLFSGGLLTGAAFDLQPNVVGTSSNGRLASLTLWPGDIVFSEEIDIDSGSSSDSFDWGGEPIFVQRPVAPIPLPAGVVLLLSAIAGLAGLRRRKQRAA